jgi:hypothetical protein
LDYLPCSSRNFSTSMAAMQPVPAAVIAWLCAAPPDDPEVAALNGQTLRAQKVALDRRLHRDWRRPVPS